MAEPALRLVPELDAPENFIRKNGLIPRELFNISAEQIAKSDPAYLDVAKEADGEGIPLEHMISALCARANGDEGLAQRYIDAGVESQRCVPAALKPPVLD